MRLCRVKKAGIFLAMAFVNVAATRTAMWSGACALLICAPEARLQTNVVCPDQMHRLAQVCQPGRIYMMLFVECLCQIYGFPFVNIFGHSGSAPQLTHVWARQVCVRENALLMGVP